MKGETTAATQVTFSNYDPKGLTQLLLLDFLFPLRASNFDHNHNRNLSLYLAFHLPLHQHAAKQRVEHRDRCSPSCMNMNKFY